MTPDDVAELRPQTQCEYCLFANWSYGDVYNFDETLFFWCDLDATGVNTPVRKNNPSQCPKYEEITFDDEDLPDDQ